MKNNMEICPVCKSARTRPFAQARDVEYYTSDEMFAYRACDSCGSLYLDNPPIADLHKIYPSNYYSYHVRADGISAVEGIKEYLDARLFRKLLQQIKGEELNVLDVGGGSGWLLTVIRKISGRVRQTHEIDINEDARRAAETAGHIFHCGPVEKFAAPIKFDLILMLNLIEHVANPAAVLNAMRQLLSAQGLIVIKTPNVDTLDCRIFRNHNWGGFHCPRHFVLFNRKSLTDLARRCGLDVASASYTQGAPQWACSILGWMGLNGWLRISGERPLYTHRLYPAVCAIAAAFDFLRMPFMPTAQMILVFKKGAGI